jgi:hypothetical protein
MICLDAKPQLPSQSESLQPQGVEEASPLQNREP